MNEQNYLTDCHKKLVTLKKQRNNIVEKYISENSDVEDIKEEIKSLIENHQKRYLKPNVNSCYKILKEEKDNDNNVVIFVKVLLFLFFLLPPLNFFLAIYIVYRVYIYIKKLFRYNRNKDNLNDLYLLMDKIEELETNMFNIYFKHIIYYMENKPIFSLSQIKQEPIIKSMPESVLIKTLEYLTKKNKLQKVKIMQGKNDFLYKNTSSQIKQIFINLD